MTWAGHFVLLPMQRASSLENTLMLGEIEGKRRNGQQKMRWLGGITNSMDMNFSKFREIGSFHGGSDGKEFACSAGYPGSILVSGRSPGEGNGNRLQYSCVGNPLNRGAWWATAHGVAKELDTTNWTTITKRIQITGIVGKITRVKVLGPQQALRNGVFLFFFPPFPKCVSNDLHISYPLKHASRKRPKNN